MAKYNIVIKILYKNKIIKISEHFKNKINISHSKTNYKSNHKWLTTEFSVLNFRFIQVFSQVYYVFLLQKTPHHIHRNDKITKRPHGTTHY